VKIRYRNPEAPAQVVPLDGERVRVTFDEPQRAIAPGQWAVCYDGDRIALGGAIE
jgi:tRNA-specific 2-thiouridylase